jgi:hypothetical protein
MRGWCGRGRVGAWRRWPGAGVWAARWGSATRASVSAVVQTRRAARMPAPQSPPPPPAAPPASTHSADAHIVLPPACVVLACVPHGVGSSCAWGWAVGCGVTVGAFTAGGAHAWASRRRQRSRLQGEGPGHPEVGLPAGKAGVRAVPCRAVPRRAARRVVASGVDWQAPVAPARTPPTQGSGGCCEGLRAQGPCDGLWLRQGAHTHAGWTQPVAAEGGVPVCTRLPLPLPNQTACCRVAQASRGAGEPCEACATILPDHRQSTHRQDWWVVGTNPPPPPPHPSPHPHLPYLRPFPGPLAHGMPFCTPHPALHFGARARPPPCMRGGGGAWARPAAGPRGV